MTNRISASQKNSMLAILFIEQKFGENTAVQTSYLRKQVSVSLSKELVPNHFLVSLRTLAKHGYVVFESNKSKEISSYAKVNESMWCLTELGREYARKLLSERERIKRAYVKRK